ncbi:hypothetical protein CS0771_51960 [Catellatospora sp. IY07-71]|uniref:hypothetical protein n=1 Tax=Catellatospora sp. IY07-71 TaxID=2728827 RepID=UPI001BB439E1|nr:hypothetical protein [Catellatospora sp. IY07-71]BCJ75652.1 hypothetical protein CS0771_51960 [Catellatospora sp. IY07-71]
MLPVPPGAIVPFIAYPVPITPPPGCGVLVFTVNRGPYLVSAASTARLRIGGQEVPFAGEGTWHVAVPAGAFEVRLTDFMGVPIMKTAVTVQPGEAQARTFDFQVWRNRVLDGQGNDAATFAMWSNYLIMVVTLVGIAVACCCGFGALITLPALTAPH